MSRNVGPVRGAARCMPIQAIHIKGRELKPHKTVISPLLSTRNVLTNNPWTFVSLWLLREKK